MKYAGIWLVFALAGCAGGEAIDAPGGVSDSGAGVEDSGSVTDSEMDSEMVPGSGSDSDSGSVGDTFVADTFVADTAVTDTGFDSGYKSTDHVHIYIDNFCKVTT